MDISEIIQTIHSQYSGAQLRKVDLHIHTPASYDFSGVNVTPEQIVDKAIKLGLDMIAITDHNCIDWCDEVRNAAKDTGLTVLPGVEITTRGGKGGLHLVAVFPEHTPSDVIVEKVLCQIGMAREDIREKGREVLARTKDAGEKEFEERDILMAGYKSITASKDLSEVMRIVASDIELLRFGLGLEPTSEKIAKEIKDLCQETLRDGKVSIVLSHVDETIGGKQRFVIQRRLGEDPKVFLENGTSVPKHPRDIFFEMRREHHTSCELLNFAVC